MPWPLAADEKNFRPWSSPREAHFHLSVLRYYLGVNISLSFQFILLRKTVKDSGEAWVICWVEERLSQQLEIKSLVILVPKPIMFRCRGSWSPCYNLEVLWVFLHHRKSRIEEVKADRFRHVQHPLGVSFLSTDHGGRWLVGGKGEG